MSFMNDEEQLRNLASTFAHRIDSLDAELTSELFDERARLHPGSEMGGPTREGRHEIREYYEYVVSITKSMIHMTCNTVIDVNGIEATGKLYYLVLRISTDDQITIVSGKYDDVYTKRTGVWRIAERFSTPLVPRVTLGRFPT
jgi:hypothetical protein